MRGEQCPRRTAALDDGLRRHLHDMPRRRRDAAIIEAVEDPRQSRRDPVIEAGRGGDDAEVAMPEIDQVASEVKGANPIVEADARMRTLRVELVRIDIRKLARPQQLVDLGRVALADQSDAVDAALDQSADLPRFLR